MGHRHAERLCHRRLAGIPADLWRRLAANLAARFGHGGGLNCGEPAGILPLPRSWSANKSQYND